VTIAFLGDGERNDTDAGVDHGCDDFGPLCREIQHIEERTDIPRPYAGVVTNSEGVEKILRCQGIARVGSPERDADDSP
jgi:hypothetical protein